MAKLFANKFNLDALANPQKQVRPVNQGEAVLKQQIPQQQGIQVASNRDVFGRTISMADRYRQYAAAGVVALDGVGRHRRQLGVGDSVVGNLAGDDRQILDCRGVHRVGTDGQRAAVDGACDVDRGRAKEVERRSRQRGG